MRNGMIGTLITLAVVALMLLAAELFLRVIYPLGGAVYQLSPVYFQNYKPGAQKIYVHLPHNGGHRIRVRINEEGFRGPELNSEASATKVMVFGDSFIAAEYSELENTFTEKLGDALAGEETGSVEVINAGVVGFGPDQMSLMIEERVSRIQPDLVIASVYAGNDYGDLLRNKLFELDGQNRLNRRHPAPSSELIEEFELKGLAGYAVGRLFQKAVVSIPRRLNHIKHESIVQEQNITAKNLPSPYQRFLDIAKLEYEAYFNSPKTVSNLFNDGFDADVSLTPAAPSAQLKSRLMSAVLQRISAYLKAQNIPVLFVAIPSARNVIEDYDGLSISSDHWPQYDPGRLTDAVCGALESGIPCVDLYPTFRDHSGSDLYFRGGDDHWNDAGQALAARIVALEIARVLSAQEGTST